MGADVAQGVNGASAVAAQQDRLAEHLVALQLAGFKLRAEGGEIPDVVQEALAEPHGSGGVSGAGLAFGHVPS